MHINPRQLDAFRNVMMTGSMTHAAELMMITQPAVSRLIKDLESELKLRLFRREGNRLIPTNEGTTLFVEVDRLYIGLDRIAKIATDLQQTKAGSLRIATIGAIATSCLPEALSRFRIDRPEVNLTIDTLKSPVLLDFVAGRHFDIGFAQARGEYPGVEMSPLPPVEAVCVIPSHFPLSRKRKITPKDLKDLPFISLSRSSPLRLQIDKLFQERDIRRHQVLELDLAASIVRLVALGQGVSIVDPFSASTYVDSRLVIRPFSPRMNFEALVVTPSHIQNSILCSELSRLMTDLFVAMQTSDVAAGERSTR